MFPWSEQKTEIAAVKILNEKEFMVPSIYTSNSSDLERPFPKLVWDFLLRSALPYLAARKDVIIPGLFHWKE